MNEIVICIGAGRSQLDYILNIKMMGYKAFCVDRNSDSPGFEIANDYIVTSTYDFENTPRFILDKLGYETNIIGAISPCTGPPYLTLQKTKMLLGLPYVSENLVKILMDKLLLRNRLNELGLSNIKNYTYLNKIDESHFPLVKKPRFGGMGGEDVELFVDYGNFKKLNNSNAIDKNFVYEELIYGKELAIDAIWYDDEIHIINIGWNVYHKDINMIIGSTSESSKEINGYKSIIAELLRILCKNLNLYREVLNVDAIVDNDQNIHIIEIEFVPADGIIHSKYSNDYDLVDAYIKCHLNKLNKWPDYVINSSILFANIIDLNHNNLPISINYKKIETNPYDLNIDGKMAFVDSYHVFYSKNNTELISYINLNYPMISFQR